MEKHHLIAVIDEKEYAEDVFSHPKVARGHDIQSFAEKAACKLGYKSKYGENLQMNVPVYNLTIVNGKIQRALISTTTVTLQQERPTEEQFEAELTQILNELPTAFRGFVSSKAWEYGHSSGYEEVLNYARDLVYDLKPCIHEFSKPIINM
jgi:hypothetical protein